MASAVAFHSAMLVIPPDAEPLSPEVIGLLDVLAHVDVDRAFNTRRHLIPNLKVLFEALNGYLCALCQPHVEEISGDRNHMHAWVDFIAPGGLFRVLVGLVRDIVVGRDSDHHGAVFGSGGYGPELPARQGKQGCQFQTSP